MKKGLVRREFQDLHTHLNRTKGLAEILKKISVRMSTGKLAIDLAHLFKCLPSL